MTLSSCFSDVWLLKRQVCYSMQAQQEMGWLYAADGCMLCMGAQNNIHTRMYMHYSNQCTYHTQADTRTYILLYSIC